MSEKTKNVRYALVAMLLLFCSAIQAQTVSGNVKDPTGEPIIGATVMEQGTQNGTVTDFDGNFSLTLKGKNNKLVISYVGMQNKTVDVTGKSSINVSMQDDAQMLDEVVAIGYGTVRKKDLTGAVAQVSAKQIENIPVVDVSQALQGKMSGVNVTVADGAPDAETTIRVRGGGSLSQDNSPLYIVDGFEVSDISDIAPSEIETIDVLKDASSTAIYGSKGANGVIIVTTKGGTDARIPKINFNASWGWKKATKFQKVLSPYDYAVAYYEANSADNKANTRVGRVGYYKDLDTYKSVEGFDYQDGLFGRTGFQQTYNFNIAGGSKQLQYNVTYSHDDQDAIMRGSGSSKNNISGKIKWKPNKYITVDANVRLSYQKVEGLGSGADTNESNAATSIVANAVSYNPLFKGASASDDDVDDDESRSNTYDPIQRLDGTYKLVKNNKQTYNLGFTWKPWKHWSFKTEFSINHNSKVTDQVWTSVATTNAKTYKGSGQVRNFDDTKKGWTSKNYVTYDNKKLFGGRDNINVVAGFDFQSTSEKTKEDFRAEFGQYNTIDDISSHRDEAKTILPLIVSELEDDRTTSFYGRMNYNMMDGKYGFTLTMRADGSSKFASGNRWGFFPAGAVSWRMSDEEFLKHSKWISNLKLRFSFGLAGNNRIKSGLIYTYYQIASNNSRTPEFDANVRPTMYEKVNSVLYNDNLKWETTITRNFGIDYGFWKGRISGSLELYWNTTKDLLMAVTIPGNTGSTTQYQNFGKTSNKGIELSSNIVAYDTKSWTVNANFNVAYNKNKIDELGQYAGEWQSSSFAGKRLIRYEDFRTVAGAALGEIWGYETDGYYKPVQTDADGNYIGGEITLDDKRQWQLDEQYSTNDSYKSLGTLRPGMQKLKDTDGDGKFTEDGDKVKLGNTMPTWTGGFGGDVTWKNTWGNIDLTVFFNYALGHQILNGTKLANSINHNQKMGYNLVSDFTTDRRYSWIDPATGYNLGRPSSEAVTYYGDGQQLQNRLAEINANAQTYNPVATEKTYITSDAVEDASFLRLQNVTIGYTFPKALVRKLYLSNLRVYFTGYNLACITGYSGSDPEVSTNKNLMCPGVDYSAYPKTRSFVAGINIAF